MQPDGYRQTRLTADSARDVVWKEICRFLQSKYFPSASTILDIGTGYGSFINNVEGKEKHALDISPEIKSCLNDDVLAHVGSCTDLGMFANSTFDLVFASNVLEHLSQQDSWLALNETLRVLRPGGQLILMQPNFKYCYREYFDDYTHVQIFTHVGLGDLLTARGFQIVQIVPKFLPFSMKSNLPKSSFLVWLYLRLPIRPFAGQMLIVAAKPNFRG